MTPEHFATLKDDFLAQLATKETLFAQDLFGGSQPEYRVKVRVVTEYAWHSHFIRTLLVRPEQAELAGKSEEHTSELQSLMRISYAVFCLKKKQLTPITTLPTNISDS